jgi:multidrug efflux pump subunit AcrB
MLLLGALSAAGMAVDIFPAIDIPVVIVVWNYPGLSAEDMDRRVTLISERGMSTSVGGLSRIDSQSIDCPRSSVSMEHAPKRAGDSAQERGPQDGVRSVAIRPRGDLGSVARGPTQPRLDGRGGGAFWLTLCIAVTLD